MSQAIRSARIPTAPRGQRGVSLLVVLILLVVMSILGLAVLRSSAMQERMSANMVDRNQAMQAAESGLRAAVNTIIVSTFNNLWDGSEDFTTMRGARTCAGHGICDRSDPSDPNKWETPPAQPTLWVTAPNGARYGWIIEYLGKAPGESAEIRGLCNTSSAPRYQCERPAFRVTAYGRGRGLAQVVLQSNIISQPL